MIPILYESTETEFTSNGLGRLRDIISCVVTEGRNEVYECDFSYPVTGYGYEKIQLGRIIAVEHDDTSDVQPFDIVSCSRPIEGVVEFHAVHISYRLAGLTVAATNINSLAAAFTALGNTTPANQFAYYSDKDSTGYVAAFDGVPRSARSILGGVEGSILDAYGGEYEFDKWTVKLWSARGQTRNFTIRYGVNLLEYNEDLDYSGSYTSVIPYWVDGNGTTIVKGSKVNSGYALYGSRDACVPLDLTEKFETKPTKAQLEEMAAILLATNKPYLPAQTISVDFVRLQDADEYSQFEDLLECKLCDTIRVIFPMYGMSGQFKIVKTVYNVLLEKYDSMELGTLSTSLSEALGISNNLEDKLDEASNGLFISTRTDVGTAFRHVVDTAGHDVGFRATVDDDTSDIHSNLFFGIGGSGVNRGIYDTTAGAWTIYRDASSSVKIPSPLSVSGTITAGTHVHTTAGAIGEYKSASNSAAVSLANSTWAALASISLTAGTWVVSCHGRFASNATGCRRMNLSTTSGGNTQDVSSTAVNGYTTDMYFTRIMRPTATTTFYLNGWQNSGSAMSMPASQQTIYAVRIA